MAFAVIRAGGRQYRVRAGDVIDVELMEDAPGPVAFDQVLLIDDDGGRHIGTPTLGNATVHGTVLGSNKGPKIKIITYHAKKRHRRKMGHRQRYTRVRIEGIEHASTAAKTVLAASQNVGSETPTAPITSTGRPEGEQSKAAARPKAAAKPKAAARPKASAKPKAAPKSKSSARDTNSPTE